MRSSSGLLLAALLVSASASADERQFKNNEPITIKSDEAYVLVRTTSLRLGWLGVEWDFSPILIRVLNAKELADATSLMQNDPRRWKDKLESNLVIPDTDDRYVKQDQLDTYLISVKPGTYVLGGMSHGMADPSLCMGTVSFEAKPGMLTDLGTIVMAEDRKPTDVPELSKIVSQKNWGYMFIVFDVALRPATGATELPASLKGLPFVQADYRAVAPFPNYLGSVVSHLAPVPGVLDYDKDGNVIDLKDK